MEKISHLPSPLPDASLHPLVLVVVCQVLGMVVGFGLSSYAIANLHTYAALAFFVSLVGCLLIWRYRHATSIAICLSVFCFGLWLSVITERHSGVALPQTVTEYDALVYSEPVRHGKVIQCDLLLLRQSMEVKVRAAILCDTVSERYKRLHVGDAIHACSFLEQPDAPQRYNRRASSGALRSPHTFDYGRWLITHGYRARTFIYYRNWTKIATSLSDLSALTRLQLTARQQQQRIRALLTGRSDDDTSLGILLAMTLGDRSLLSHDVKDVFAVTSASHVLALSGLHLSILYGVLMLLFAPFRRLMAVRLVLIATIWMYAFLVGLPLSVVRAAMMLTIYSMVLVLNRKAVPLNVLSFSAIVMLIAHPYSLFDIGFQLSYLAVAAILLFTPLFTNPVRNTFIYRWHVTRWVYSLFAASIAAQLGTAPLVAYYFGRVSCLFLLTNSIAIPLVTAILWIAPLFFLCGWWTALQVLLGQILTLLAQWLNTSLAFLAAVPGASIEHLSPSVLQVVACYILIGVAYGICVLQSRK